MILGLPVYFITCLYIEDTSLQPSPLMNYIFDTKKDMVSIIKLIRHYQDFQVHTHKITLDY